MTDESIKTGENLEKPPKPGTFQKGFDPRRNLRGVPKETIKMREHMRQIAAEIVGGNSEEETRLDAMLRLLWKSKNPAHNKLALQILNPKILQEHVDLTTDGEPLNAKGLDDERFDRSISTLVNALREIVPGADNKQDGKLGSTK